MIWLGIVLWNISNKGY